MKRLEPFLNSWLKKQTGLTFLNADSLKKWQMQKVREVIDYACSNSTFFGKYLADYQVSPFKDIPFTDSHLLMEHVEQMLCVSLGDVSRIRTFSTSGTTGKPKRIFFSEEDLESTTGFFAEGMESIAPIEKETLILMSDAKPGSIASLLQEGLQRKGRSARIYGRPKNLAEAIAAAKKAGCLVGFPADIFYLCRKEPMLRPASVLLSADYIPASVIKGIKEAWKCEVFSHYGLTETCYGLAVDCPKHQGMHIRQGDFYVEIIDPITLAPLAYGQEGEIVLTSLQKGAMPLIRYRTGDIGTLTASTCGCGCDLPRLMVVCGRYANLCETINIHKLDDIMYTLPGLAGYGVEIEQDYLSLTVDGSKLSESELQQKIRYPVQLTYTGAAPWDTGGKRGM